MYSKPFGAATTTSGFGTFGTPQASANPFAQSQLFNKTPSTSGGFGSSQPAFGQQPSTSGLFQNANTPAFGATPTGQTGFGSSTLFGQQQQQQPSTSGLFGASTFGQQNKSSTFGFGAQQNQSGIFGQQQTQTQPQGSLYQGNSSANIFGQSTSFVGGTAAQTGTVIKFTPVTGTDTMQKGGIATTISTKQHCITCMKEYETKSLEELRYEDYLANRKGPQQQSGFGATPFGAPASTAASIFGKTDNKPAFGQTPGFGQTTPSFGQPTAGFGLQNQQNTSGNLFGKPTTGFGAPSTGSAFGFGTNTSTNTLFGNAQQPKLFGSTAQPTFGATTSQQTPAFATGIFGQSGTQPTAGSSLFGKPNQPTVSQTQGFSFSQPTTTSSSLFQQPKMGFGLFGQTSTSTPAFGQTNTFGQAQPTFGANPLGKTTTPTFSSSGALSFGTVFATGTQQTGTPSLFGNTQPKQPTLFGTGTGSLFNNSVSFQQPVAGGFTQQQQQPPLTTFPTADPAENVLLVASTQFPLSPHLAGLTPLKKTDPPQHPTYRPDISAIPAINERISTKSHKLNVKPIERTKKSSIFDEQIKKEEEFLYEHYILNNQKRLVIKKKTEDDTVFSDPDEEILAEVRRINELNENKSSVEQLQVEEHNEDDIAATRSRSSTALSKKTEEDTSVINGTDIVAEEKKSEENQKHHPCNIILTRPEYFTVPSLSEIEQYKNEDGTCLVKGFTVGRIGYGNVYFPDVMDVSNLNLDEIVFFRYKEVTVYPDSYPNKPPVGQGLNRRAQITLDHVYPKVRGQEIKDLDKLLKMGYIENLKQSCARQGCKFLEYRVETGSWVFESKHFTTYKLDFFNGQCEEQR